MTTTQQNILNKVCAEYKTALSEIKHPQSNHGNHVKECRHVVVFFLHVYESLSYAQICEIIRYKHRKNCGYAYKSITDKLESDAFNNKLTTLKTAIYGY